VVQNLRLNAISAHASPVFFILGVAPPVRAYSVLGLLPDADSLRSGTELKFPNAISCFSSFPKPNFAARINATHIKPYLRPLVILGEAKKDFYNQTPWETAHLQPVAAQLAWSAQPTLNIMILAAVSDHKQKMAQEGLRNMVNFSSVPG